MRARGSRRGPVRLEKSGFVCQTPNDLPARLAKHSLRPSRVLLNLVVLCPEGLGTPKGALFGGERQMVGFLVDTEKRDERLLAIKVQAADRAENSSAAQE